MMDGFIEMTATPGWKPELLFVPDDPAPPRN